jgi:hypothetical protein
VKVGIGEKKQNGINHAQKASATATSSLGRATKGQEGAATRKQRARNMTLIIAVTQNQCRWGKKHRIGTSPLHVKKEVDEVHGRMCESQAIGIN